MRQEQDHDIVVLLDDLLANLTEPEYDDYFDADSVCEFRAGHAEGQTIHFAAIHDLTDSDKADTACVYRLRLHCPLKEIW